MAERASAPPRTNKPGYWSRARIVTLVAGGLAVLTWLVLAFLQMAVAWGARGMKKPSWFFAVTYTTYLAPLLGAAGLALGMTKLPRLGALALVLVVIAEAGAIVLSLTYG